LLKHSFRYYAVLVSTAAALLAAGPVGSVTSSSSFLLRGVSVNVHGVPSWPLASGDDIAAGSDSAAIQLKDGSKVVLDANAHAMIDMIGGVLSLRLLSGTMTVTPAQTPSVRFYSGSELLQTRPGMASTVSARETSKTGVGLSAVRTPTPPPPAPPVSKK
jgi:ferric-dicitrate binding protein FerR (iron transport regulator)